MAISPPASPSPPARTVAGTQLQRLPVRGDRAGHVPLLLQDRPEQALRFREVRPQLDRVAQLRRRSLEVALLERRAPLEDVQARGLVAIVGRHQLAALLQLGGGFLLAAGAGQGEAELVARLAALGREPRRLLQLLDRLRDLAVPQERLAERQVGPGERGRRARSPSRSCSISFARSLRGAGAVGGREVEPGLHGARREGDGLLELPDGFLGVGGGEGRAEVGVRVRDSPAAIRTASRNAAMPPGSSPAWTSTRPRLLWASAKPGWSRIASRNSAATSLLSAPVRPSRRPEDVAARRLGPGSRASAWRSAATAAVPVRRGQPRAGEVQPGFELSQRLVEVARAEVRDPRST